MPLYFIHVQSGDCSSSCVFAADRLDRETQWKELISVASDIVGDACGQLQQNREWQIELQDEARKPLVRLRLLGETVETRRSGATLEGV